MAFQLATFTRLRATLLERYAQPPLEIPASRLEAHLEERVFVPLQELRNRVDRLGQIAGRLATGADLAEDDRRGLVAVFQDTLESILVDFQRTLLDVPTETVVADEADRG